MLEEGSSSFKKASITVVAPTSITANSSKQDEVIYQNEDVTVGLHECGPTDNSTDFIVIKIDGEKHWVSGVDSQTTCANLISALLCYQDIVKKRCSIEDGLSNTLNVSNKLGRSINMSSHNKNYNSSTTNTKEKQTFFSECLKNSHEYVIVKQLRHGHFEEYLDGSTRLLDVIPKQAILTKKQCGLQLRHLSARIYNQKQNHVLSMSTDKDSGMGSPVGSSRNERYRRWRAKQRAGNVSLPAMTLYRGCSALSKQTHQQKQKHQVTHCNVNPNDRLMNIILNQDETINRQICLLNQKEQQIVKIENEKHRVRELKMGKNYLLGTYLNEPDTPDFVLFSRGEPNRFETMNSRMDESKLPKDMDIYWLEKVYGLNILLQREEEQLLRLHAKVRKHHVKCAYHTKDEVLQQINIMDTELAKQVVDIYSVERQLLIANEQLKAKLGVLESLGHELEIMPIANFDVDKNVAVPLRDLTFDIIEDVWEFRESMARTFIQNPEETNIDNPGNKKYIKNRVEKNSNVWNHADAKLLNKQMFFVENSETCHKKLPNNACSIPKSIEEPKPIASCQASLETKMILTLADCDFHLQQFGTLV